MTLVIECLETDGRSLDYGAQQFDSTLAAPLLEVGDGTSRARLSRKENSFG